MSILGPAARRHAMFIPTKRMTRPSAPLTGLASSRNGEARPRSARIPHALKRFIRGSAVEAGFEGSLAEGGDPFGLGVGGTELAEGAGDCTCFSAPWLIVLARMIGMAGLAAG